MSKLDGIKKKLNVYKEGDDYVIQRINEIGECFTSRHNRAGLIESLNNYKRLDELPEYEINPSDELWALVLNTLQSE